MVWKMDSHLSNALVPREGHLDPYDGYVTYRVLQGTMEGGDGDLDEAIADFAEIVQSRVKRFSTVDPLDCGESLVLSSFFPEEEWAKTVRAVSLEAFEVMKREGVFDRPLNDRLAFRELGMTIGLQAAGDERHSNWISETHSAWAGEIPNRESIDQVMFACSLLPDALLRGWSP